MRLLLGARQTGTSQNACLEANFPESHCHINWNVRAKRVECPVNLTRVTGCKLNPQGLPQANPAARDAATADSTFVHRLRHHHHAGLLPAVVRLPWERGERRSHVVGVLHLRQGGYASVSRGRKARARARRRASIEAKGK